MKLNFYWNPTRLLIENGCFSKLPEVINHYSPKAILLVLGEKSFRASPYYPRLQAMLEQYDVEESLPVPANPTQKFIQQELLRLRERKFDIVMAIGGGSVLDTAKILANLIYAENNELNNYINSDSFTVPARSLPLIAIPTTAGTGSEVTPFSSLETAEKKKVSITSLSFYPTVAVVDPELCYSMPAYVTASTGFDALSQAIESFWSVLATPVSQTHSLRALEMILAGLTETVKEPHSREGRLLMSYGSCEAGLAIAQARTTAVHSVSYPITTHFGIAHGHACALTLASFVRFNGNVLGSKGAPLMARFFSSTYEDVARRIEVIMETVGLERSLKKLGIPESGIEIIVREGFRPDRVKNNPRELDAESLSNILINLL